MSRLHLAVATFVCVALPLAARAVEEVEGGEGVHDQSLLWHAVNLAILLAILIYFARPPIRRFMAERRSTIETGIESAQRDLAEAERRLAECNERVASLDREIDDIRAAVRSQAEAARDRLLAEAHASAARIRRDAVTAVEQEARRAREGLRAEAAALAVRLAGEILERQVTDADRAQLIDDFVARIEAPPAPPAARS